MSRNVKRARRIFLEANGDGPWKCLECSDLVESIGGFPVYGDTGIIHHLDEDTENDVPENLVLLHSRCHLSIHARGEKNFFYGKVMDVTRFSGHFHTEESKEQTRQSMKNRLASKPRKRDVNGKFVRD